MNYFINIQYNKIPMADKVTINTFSRRYFFSLNPMVIYFVYFYVVNVDFINNLILVIK